ncbi:MAG: diacylglycerol kinase family lipid kinase [Erysipelotrichaceae bacterium]|nr:diacylglycerol kinase family lipid kinase [Erysipelotrichaceae bacterium]MBR3168733.1 diacylglycerol kinase family lipid kinase [Erysipelotrichaceae bacterium]
MRSLFIINPKAGDGKRIEILKNEISVLSEKENCEIYLTKGVRDATRYVSEYLTGHADEKVRCIACGGDGTLNEVVNGAVGHANASVSVYPIGSGNDFVKSVGGAEKFLSAEALIHAPVREIDLLKAGEHYSINVINFGFDTAVAITVNEDRDRTGHGNRNSYTKGIVKALMTNMRNAGTVKADGETLDPSGKFLLCTIANGQYIGGKFRCAPHADLNDGLMEVCLLDPISYLRFFRILKTYTEGRHVDDPKLQDIVHYRRARKAEVIAPEGFAYSLDGEIIRENHFTVEIVPKALKFAVPE